ncbi:MAG: GNAT family N-acetyltransferase [Anaerolineae bacterium]
MNEANIRPATQNDHEAVVACTHTAFSKWVPIIGMKPMALTADYAAYIARGVVYVVDGEAALDGVLILWPEDGAMYIDTVAVNPARQGSGLGRQLMNFAEQQAQAAGLKYMTLLTNEKMVDNQLYYKHLGYQETRREELAPGRRAVWMHKTLTEQNG